MLFAEMSDTVWLAWIAVVALIVKQILEWISAWIISRRADKEAAKLAAKVAKAAEDVVVVKDTLAATTTATTKRFDTLDGTVGEVHELVNGLAQEKARAAGNAGFDAGEAGKPNPTKQ